MSENRKDISRRDFLRLTSAGLGAFALGGNPLSAALPAATHPDGMPTRPFGKTGATTSLLGFGGFQIGLRSLDDEKAARVVHEAMDHGITFFESAREYNEGISEERLGKALQGGRRSRVFLTTKNCGHERDYKGAMTSLEASLKALHTDCIDLWMFHEVVYDNDPEWIFTRGGIEAAIEARKAGKIRFIGFSGHKHPDIMLDMLQRPFEWDAVMLPLNVMDSHFRSFEHKVLPELLRRKIAVIAMKVFGGFMSEWIGKAGLTAEECLRYTMSLPIATAAVGMETLDHVRANLKLVGSFKPMTPGERRLILARTAPIAGDGRHEKYKMTMDFDAPTGQKAHGFKP